LFQEGEVQRILQYGYSLGVENEGIHKFGLGEWLRDDFVGSLGDEAGDVFRQSIARDAFEELITMKGEDHHREK